MNLDELIEKLQVLELEVGSRVPVYVVDARNGASDLVECASSRTVDHDEVDGVLYELESGKTYISISVG